MTLIRTLFILFGLCTAMAAPGLAQSAETETAPVDTPPERFSAADLEQVYDAYFAPDNGMSYTGAVVTVVQDGEIVFSKGYGYADADRTRPVRPDETPFPVGSVTKTLVGVATAQLLEDEVFRDVDAPVNDYMSRATIPDNQGEAITLRMLATHQAGFAEQMQPYMKPGQAEPETNGRYIRKITPAYIRPVLSGPNYSNAGIGLLGYAIEDASGQDFDDYVEEHIFGPAGMTVARIVKSADDRAGVAQGEIFYPNGGRRPVPTEWANNHTNKTAGGMVVSGDDMGRYMIALMGGSNDGAIPALTSDAARELMFSRLGESHPLTQAYGLTFMVNDWNGHRLAEHGGRVLAGASYMSLLPDERIGMFVSVTGDSGVALPVPGLLGKPGMPPPEPDTLMPIKRPTLSYLRALPLEAMLGRYLPPIATDKVEISVAEYAGEYIADRRSTLSVTKLFKILFRGGGPVIVSDNGDGTITFGPYGRYEPIGEDVFYKAAARENKGASGWSDLVVFKRSENDRIISASTTYTDTVFRKAGGVLKPSMTMPVFLIGFAGALSGLLALLWAPKTRGRWIAFALPFGLIAVPIILFRSWPSSTIESLSYLFWSPGDLIGLQLFGNALALGTAILIGFAIASFFPAITRPMQSGWRATLAKWHLRLMTPFMCCLLIALIWLGLAGWNLG